MSTPNIADDHSEIQDADISPFLALPRELRDNIYLFLLNERYEPPEDPSQCSNRSTVSSKIYLEPHSPKPALLQLKLTSKQLHAEAKKIIAKHIPRSPGQAHLDIMVMGHTIYPTWIFLPLTRRLQPTIEISLRLFSSTGWGTVYHTSAYPSLCSLFKDLVLQGPCLHSSLQRPRAQSLATPLEIHSLRFDIRLCFPTTVDDLFGVARDVFDPLQQVAEGRVGLYNVKWVEACFGSHQRKWAVTPFFREWL